LVPARPGYVICAICNTRASVVRTVH
jgi:hypothetical protein